MRASSSQALCHLWAACLPAYDQHITLWHQGLRMFSIATECIVPSCSRHCELVCTVS